jgi:hypothetical protein
MDPIGGGGRGWSGSWLYPMPADLLILGREYQMCDRSTFPLPQFHHQGSTHLKAQVGWFLEDICRYCPSRATTLSRGPQTEWGAPWTCALEKSGPTVTLLGLRKLLVLHTLPMKPLLHHLCVSLVTLHLCLCCSFLWHLIEQWLRGSKGLELEQYWEAGIRQKPAPLPPPEHPLPQALLVFCPSFDFYTHINSSVLIV